MKKVFFIITLFCLSFTFVFSEDLYSRPNVNTIRLDSIQNGEYVYIANLFSKTEDDIRVVIDIFKNGEYVISYDVTPTSYKNDSIYDSYLWDKTIKFTKIDSESVAFCSSYTSPLTKNDYTCVSFYKIKNDKLSYFSTINFSEIGLGPDFNYWGLDDLFFTYDELNKKFYFSSRICVDFDKYNHDFLLIKLDSNFNVEKSSRLYSSKWDAPENIFSCNGKLYVCCDFGDLSFSSVKVLVFDSNLNILDKYEISGFTGEIFCDGKNIFTVTKTQKKANVVSIKCFDLEFTEQWETLWEVVDARNVAEITDLYDFGDKMAFSYINQNEYNEKKTNFVIFSKDGSTTDFYNSGFYFYPRFYFVNDKIFVSGTNHETFVDNYSATISQTSYVGIKALSEMEKLDLESYEDKPKELVAPSELSPENQRVYIMIMEDMIAQSNATPIGPSVTEVNFQVMKESYDLLNTFFESKVEKVNLEYVSENPFSENFMKSLPAYELSER